MADLEAELDRLYGLPLGEFTDARNELAKQLRKDGSREDAERVRALSKPSIGAWAVNQLARHRTSDVSALLDAGAALRKSQGSALAGGEGGGDALRKAAHHHGEKVRALAAGARELLGEEGRPVSDATIERVAQTLRSASVDEQGRRLLAHGRLSSDQAAAGFDAVAALPRAGGRPSRTSSRGRERQTAAAERRRARELDAEARRLARDAEKVEREAARAEQEADRLREAASAARAEAERARDEAESAAARLSGGKSRSG